MESMAARATALRVAITAVCDAAADGKRRAKVTRLF